MESLNIIKRSQQVSNVKGNVPKEKATSNVPKAQREREDCVPS